MVITVAYLVFWGPLVLVTLFSYGDYKTETPSTSHEVTLHVAFVHAFVNPALFIVLHKGLRKAAIDLVCCNFRAGDVVSSTATDEMFVKEDLEGTGAASGAGPGGVDGDKVAFQPAHDGGVPISSVNRTYM